MTWVHSTQGQTFDQLTRPIATVTRPAQIDTILSELFIPPPDTVSHLDIVDLTGNGYGPDDVVIVYPSQATYPVSVNVPRTLKKLMSAWELEADYRLDATLGESETVAADAHQREDPRAAISGDIVTAITRYYDGTDIDLRLSRTADGMRLDMWNYDPQAMRYAPQACYPGGGQRFRFAEPRFVVAFAEPDACIEAHREGTRIVTQPCTHQ